MLRLAPSHSGDITQSGDIKAVQNIAINTNQTYQNEGKDTNHYLTDVVDHCTLKVTILT
jgi:hypothetical protein